MPTKLTDDNGNAKSSKWLRENEKLIDRFRLTCLGVKIFSWIYNYHSSLSFYFTQSHPPSLHSLERANHLIELSSFIVSNFLLDLAYPSPLPCPFSVYVYSIAFLSLYHPPALCFSHSFFPSLNWHLHSPFLVLHNFNCANCQVQQAAQQRQQRRQRTLLHFRRCLSAKSTTSARVRGRKSSGERGQRKRSKLLN